MPFEIIRRECLYIINDIVFVIIAHSLTFVKRRNERKMLIETENHSWKRVPDVMLRDTRLRLSDVAVFACLLDLCKDTLQVSVSCKEIAQRVSRTRKYVMQSLAVLETYGYIERQTVSGGISTYLLAPLVPAEKRRRRKTAETAPKRKRSIFTGEDKFTDEELEGYLALVENLSHVD